MPQVKNVPPRPASTIQSLRHLGYSLDSALADIIDNSIGAHSTHISIDYRWNQGTPYIAILDNGTGMDRDELIQNMAFGCKKLTDNRTSTDLGRFGMGMKTASISQCRTLTVISKIENEDVYASQWSLCHIEDNENGEWPLLIFNQEDLEGLSGFEKDYVKQLSKQTHGTIVIWADLDLNGPGLTSIETEQAFNSALSNSLDYLKWVFYKFLNEIDDNSKVLISVNGLPLQGRNPFESAPRLHGGELRIANTRIRSYVLRHEDQFKSSQDYQEHSGPRESYLKSQGIYVYRAGRLISHSTWFRMRSKEKRTQLARIEIDITNDDDTEWKLTVKKSELQPPAKIRSILKGLIGNVCEASAQVMSGHAYPSAQPDSEQLWIRVADGTNVNYCINPKHSVFEQLPKEHAEQTLKIIKKICNDLPIEGIVMDREKAQYIPTQTVKIDYTELTQTLLSL